MPTQAQALSPFTPHHVKAKLYFAFPTTPNANMVANSGHAQSLLHTPPINNLKPE